jgi:hypothetical protein
MRRLEGGRGWRWGKVWRVREMHKKMMMNVKSGSFTKEFLRKKDEKKDGEK